MKIKFINRLKWKVKGYSNSIVEIRYEVFRDDSKIFTFILFNVGFELLLGEWDN